ncbi:GntR family transcriptional regulator [Nocardia jiangxiensis]|uniref:GntR family transcriptional regulator n=1 Tax=Nocardia jiangxiensis TaxID=282685 RepID=A0ABW6S782_9NOCA|nr:GntR family transcriptional regulator [Nocardia jiangxiensis]
MGDGSDSLLGEAVYKQLLDRIFTGELPPGAPLSVPALAAALDVSRSPVRDSVQRLVADGLAVHTPHAGARVAHVDEREIADVLAVRELLDGYAAREATLRASTSDVRRLAALVEGQQARLAEPADALAEARHDLEFHTAVRDLAGNRALSDALHRLDAKAHLYNTGLWSDEAGRRFAVAEHVAIVHAIEIGDAACAERAAAAHVAALGVRMRRLARG